LRLRTTETLSLAARFYRRYLWSWDVTAGFLAALVAFALLAGALYALFNVFPPLVNALWGLCVLGQSVVPMRRIMEMEVTGRQELKAMAR